MAHVKAAGSTANGRDSNPKYRGVKLFWGQKCIAWNIVVTQQWLKMEPGKNAYFSRDFTIHAKIDWVVSFSKKKCVRFDGRRYLKTIINIVPVEEINEEVVSIS